MNGLLIMQIFIIMLVIAFGAIGIWGTIEMIKPLEASKSKKPCKNSH